MENLEELINALEAVLSDANEAQKEYEMLALTLIETKSTTQLLSAILPAEEAVINARFRWNEIQAAVEVQRERIALKKLLMQRDIAFKGMY